jgi:hypothetical protein
VLVEEKSCDAMTFCVAGCDFAVVWLGQRQSRFFQGSDVAEREKNSIVVVLEGIHTSGWIKPRRVAPMSNTLCLSALRFATCAVAALCA